MKLLHRKDLFGWSVFNEARNLDFHSILWQREHGNVLIDPLPLSAHDLQHLEQLGGAQYIVITNSDHCRDAVQIAEQTGAKIYAPAQERNTFLLDTDHWLGDGESVVPGLVAIELNGSKTPGELALLLDNQTLITGDLIRCHQAGQLCLLPDSKLTDKALAIESVKRLASISTITAVLPGDGWPVFSHGAEALADLVKRLTE